MLFLLLSITLIYTLLIIAFTYGFNKVETFEYSLIPPETKFSVIIPFRNEASSLPELILSIKNLDYPSNFFELIFIDDQSNDNSDEIIKEELKDTSIVFSILQNKNDSRSPKKTAINLGITTAKYDWIITTDADCMLQKNWLKVYNSFILNKRPKMVIGPVVYNATHYFVEQFQHIDILSLQAVTIGAFGLKKPFLCNGANLAYEKNFFFELNGFEGNTEIASGDDIFLMEKAIKQDNESVHYLKSTNTIVKTSPQPNFSQLVQQRVRWAAKTSYTDWFSRSVGLVVLLMNIAIIIGILLAIFQSLSWTTIAIVMVIKFTVDFWCIGKTAKFFNQNFSIKWYILSCSFYPFFTTFVALKASFSGYQWKGRSFSK